jgi:hypothetical protein
LSGKITDFEHARARRASPACNHVKLLKALFTYAFGAAEAELERDDFTPEAF